MALGRKTPDSCRARRFLLPDTRTATLGSSPCTWRRGSRCVLTAAGGRAPGPAEALHVSHRPPGAPASPAIHLLSPRQTRLPEPGPGQGSLGTHGAGGKLVAALQSPLPWTGTHTPAQCTHIAPRLESPRTPPSHLPASAARPGLGPASRAVLFPRAGAASDPQAGAGAANRPEPGSRLRALRTSEQAGGWSRCDCCHGSPHPLRPSAPPSSLLPPLSLSLPPPFRPSDRARSLALFPGFLSAGCLP